MTRGRCAIRAMPFGRSRVAALAVALAAITSTSHDARADEGGISMWLPGLFGSIAAAPQVPGWASRHRLLSYLDKRGRQCCRRARSHDR